MQNLNKLDLLHFKYMVIGTKILNKDEVKKIDDYKKVLDLITEKSTEEQSRKIENEALYNLKCYSLIHRNNTCPAIYERPRDNIFTNETLFLVQLFENLNEEDSFYVLENFFNTDQKKYLDLELDLESIDLSKSLQKGKEWLINKDKTFCNIIQNFLKSNSPKIDGGIPKPSDKADGGIPELNRKGICFVISNYIVEGHSTRKGTEADEKTIKETFEAQGFEVRVKRDVKCGQMTQFVEEVKEKIEDSDKLIAVFVMSHGDVGCIITSDGKDFVLDNLYEEFYNAKCPLLAGKPKLFFIVSCQGTKKNIASDSPAENKPCKREKRLHKEANFFYGYATYKTYVSGRDPESGTLYVRSLCKAIKSSKTGSIHEIHNEVNEDVKKECKNIDGIKCYQTPCYSTTLGTKNHFIFDPKIH